MLRFAIRRIPVAALTLALASVGIFLLMQILPGSPAAMVLGDQATPEAVAALEAELGLDRPLHQQYLSWLGGLFSGDLGLSYVTRMPISELVAPAAAATLQLALASLLVTTVVGFALGIVGAVGRNRVLVVLHRVVNAFGFGAPEYVVGILLVLVLAVSMRVLPAGGGVSFADDPGQAIAHLVLPVTALSLHSAVVVGRFLETALKEQLDEEYLDTARAKGASRMRVLWRHALPNALPSVITVLGLRVGHLFAGAVVIEAVFAWPGLGQVLTSAVTSRDYLLVQDLVLFSVAVFITVQLVTDLIHAALDPRIKLEKQ